MSIETWIAIIGLLCGMITIWVNLNVKIKEIEVNLEQLKKDKSDLDEKIWNKLDKIDNKLDEKFEVLTILKTEHEQMKNKCINFDKK